MAKNETPVKYELAYQFWRNDGIHNRSYDQVAIEFNVSAASISNWAKKYKWKERMLEETKQINENIKRECFERVEAGCKYYTRVVDDIVSEYKRQILSGELKLTHDAVIELMKLSADIERGQYKDSENTTKADTTLSDFMSKLGEVITNASEQEQSKL